MNKLQEIKDWISKEQDGLMDAQGNFEFPEHEGAYHILCNLDAYIDSLQEEPVSEDLGEYINELSKLFPEVSFAKLSRIAVRVAKWQKQQMIDKACEWIEEHSHEYMWNEKYYNDIAKRAFLKAIYK